MNDPCPDTPSAAKPRRRWYQFSLRTLLIFMLVAGCTLGWVGKQVHDASIRKEMDKELSRQGVLLAYDYQYDAQGNFQWHPKSSAPLWLQNLLGRHYFGNVTGVTVSFGLGDPDLKFLQAFDQLQYITFVSAHTSPQGVESLAKFPNLRLVSAVCSPIPDAELRKLKRALPNCKIIASSGKDIELPDLE